MNKIISRYYITADITLASPLSLSGGIEENTDSDVMRDGEGRLFIPGSSVAGAFRSYLGQKKDDKGIFGYSGKEEKKEGKEKKEEGYMSSLFFSDIYFEEKHNSIVSERDGVSLSNEKIVSNKFDYEIIETGAKANMRIEKIYREKDKEKGFQDGVEEIRELLSALNKGEIRFGSRKNRGCGWIKVEKVYKHEFTISKEIVNGENIDKKEYERWIKYCKSCKECRACDNDALWESWEKELEKEQFLSITIPLRLTGGISIRKYSAQPEKADFEHITIHSENENPIPVIPGSSWNGAIRSCAKNIMQELRIGDINSKIEQWFGFVNTSEKKAQQSMVVIKESQLENAVSFVSTRNKVNRFDASTVDGALYTENAYFGGKTILHILVRKTEDERYMPLLGLLSLIIKEIEEGYLAIGGQTAVGRGIFEANIDDLDKKVIWSEKIDEKKCLKELALLRGEYKV